MHELGISLLSVQEARSPPGARDVGGYIVLLLVLTEVLWGASYGPTRRSLMPALMVRTITSGCLTLLPSSLTRGSSWCVSLPGACSVRTVVVAHALHSGAAAADRDAWWSDLARRLAGQPDVVLLVDANARLGSSVSSFVGGGGFCQQEGVGGGLFHRTSAELDLCVPATFCPADTSAFTWVANGGATHRIDYVAVPRSWGCSPEGCSLHDVATT